MMPKKIMFGENAEKSSPTQIMPLSLPQLLQTFIINGWITWESRTMRFMTR